MIHIEEGSNATQETNGPFIIVIERKVLVKGKEMPISFIIEKSLYEEFLAHEALILEMFQEAFDDALKDV